MARTASKIIEQAQAWIGLKESDGSHRLIIDLYNSHKPLARSYRVKYTDSWCATFISALAIKCGYTDLIPTECSCQRMIELFKAIGKWGENENRTPSPGDIIFYDWGDSGKGDNKGWADHVGIVEKVEGSTITVIEGNYSDSVKRRTISINNRYIRGYATPEYETEGQQKPTVHIKAKDSAKAFDLWLAGNYTTTGNLWLRHGAGTLKKKIVVIPKGTKVKCYGYFTKSGSTNWLYIQFTLKGVKYTGFASGKYLKK
jgi:hypothetical protein